MRSSSPNTCILEPWLWPTEQLEEAVELLARQAGLATEPSPAAGRATSEDPVGATKLDCARRLRRVAARIGLEVEPVGAPYGDVLTMVHCAGPGVVLVPGGGVLALLGPSRRGVRVLGPAARRGVIAAEDLAAIFRSGLESPLRVEVEELLERIGVPESRRPRARRTLLMDRLQRHSVGPVWYLREPPSGSFVSQLRKTSVPRWFGLFVGNYAVSYGVLLGSWWAIGVGALQGRLVFGWLVAWALLLLTLIPFRVVSVWSRAQAAIGVGTLLKRRLLAGALELRPEEIRHQGAGQLLGRVIEAEALQTYLLEGGVMVAVGLIETAFAGLVLTQGSGGWLHAALLLVWLGATGLLGVVYLRARRRWTASRLGMTHALVEGLVGHRTRLAQEPRDRWHEAEDRHLELYLAESRRMDRSRVVLLALVPRGWMVVGIGALLPAFLAGTGSLAGFAIGLGGTLAAFRGLAKLAEGSSHVAAARIVWEQSEELVTAARRGRPEEPGLAPAGASQPSEPLLEVRGLHFRHPGRAQPTLSGCDLEIFPGDRLLLEGASGGGKSTLASILNGLREPNGGLLLLRGIDRAATGLRAWRSRVITVPQFHENHVFTGTLAFNLLMGRGWPPTEEDLKQARELCGELGLGDLLERMPGGLQQVVGETGWQLSHGERNRLFLARALLQQAELIILDETLAALDPGTLHTVLETVRRKAPALVVISHFTETSGALRS